MNTRHGFIAVTLILLLLAGITFTAALAAGIPQLVLPTTTVTTSYTLLPSGIQAYFLTNLSGVGGGYDVANGDYLGWCIDPYSGQLIPPTAQATLYNSYDPSLPAGVASFNGNPIPWHQINYLLNHKGSNAVNVIQPAIWLMITGDRNAWITGWDCPVNSPCDQMVDDAMTNGANFVPAPGEIIAVIVYINGISTSGDDGWQDNLIEVTLPNRPASVGDFAWIDGNMDGIQDPGATGLAGVTVQLFTSGGTLVDTQVTTSTGLYNFTNLTPGDYYIQYTAPGTYQFSPQYQGGNTALDSNANPTTGQTDVFTLASGETDNTIDVGLFSPTAINLASFSAQSQAGSPLAILGLGALILLLVAGGLATRKLKV